MEVRIPELVRIEAKIEKILTRLDELESRQLSEWVTLEEACVWKGVNAKTIQQTGNRHLMPNLLKRRTVGGRLKFPVMKSWNGLRRSMKSWGLKRKYIKLYDYRHPKFAP